METAIGAPFVDGNAIDWLKNGTQIFPAMLEAVKNAEIRIEFLTFVYWKGEIAGQFADAFCERARAGVEVLVMLDGYGGRQIDDGLVARMREAGVVFRWFRPLLRTPPWQIDNRTHRKLLIVDGRVGFTGGVGIAEEWAGDARNSTQWRDNHYRIEGPVVAALRAAFYDNWMERTASIEKLALYAPRLPAKGSLKVQPVSSTSGTGWSAIARLHEAMILGVRERLRIATPYFAPRERAVTRLVDALRRGVKVEVLIPGDHVDKRVSELAGAGSIGRLLDEGAAIFRFAPTMLHVKLVTIDGELTSIGSANVNMRSHTKDDELALNVLDRGFTAVADRTFDDDLLRADAIEKGAWRRRGAVRRLAEAATGLIKGEV